MEAAFSNRHSAVSENQHQHQRPVTAKPLHGADAEDAKESKQNQHQRPLTTKDTKDTEGGTTVPLSHGMPGDEQERVKQRVEALAVKLARTYEELTRLLARNPAMKRQITEGETREEKVYQKLKQRLKMADMAPRCQWVRQDGTSCRSPQMKQHIYCFAHRQMMAARELMLMLPPPEDANAIQVGLMRIQKALTEDTISMKKAGLLLYSMQLALTNVGQTTFGKAKDEEMVRETMSEDDAFSEHQKPFTTKDTKDTEEIGTSGHPTPTGAKAAPSGGPGHRVIGSAEHQNLPRMYADDRGLKMRIEPVEFKPTPDMYRMDTPEGREAYEASLRRSGERRPSQAVIAQKERAETYANLG